MEHSTVVAALCDSDVSPLAADLQMRKAQAFQRCGNHAAALALFAAIGRKRSTADNFLAQAVCLVHLEQPMEALQCCDRALALDSGHPQAWLFRGVALHRLGRFPEAYRCYRRASDPYRRLRVFAKPWQPLKAVFARLARVFRKGRLNSFSRHSGLN